MTPDFNVADSSTWPAVMDVDQIAAIYRRAAGGVRKACQEHTFVPAPFLTRPFRFRKVDVLRHVEGSNSSSLRRAS